MQDLDLFSYWKCFCGESGDKTDTLCYWKRGCCNLDEDCLAEWEHETELKDFMSDWEEYISEES